jgi:hypothetical protein
MRPEGTRLPSKSDVVIVNGERIRQTQTWTLGKQEIEEVQSTKHIGLIRRVYILKDIWIYAVFTM